MISKRLASLLPLVFLLSLYVALQWRYVALDFWNDELYTLRFFACRPFYAILTDYHVPNNHILFNLLNHLYLLALGTTDFHELLPAPWRLRFLMLVYAGFSLWIVWETGRRFFSLWTGHIAIAITITTLPFLNFALQIRGYGLSTLWLTGLLYTTLLYHEKQNWLSAIGIIGFTTLLMYTVPSNLYFILAIGLFWGLLWIKDLIKDGFDFRNKALQVALLTAIGLKLALLAYLPVFDQVFNNPYVTYEPFKWDNLTYYGPVVLGDFVSKRWWLLPFVILGYALGRRHWQKASKAVLLLLTVLIVPFLLVYILGNTAPKRIFIPLIPVFSLLLATGICAEVRQLPWFKGQQLVALILIAGYGVFTVFQGWEDSRERLMSDIQLGGRSQGLTHQYFTWHYHPNREVDFYSKQHYDSKIPVCIVGCEPHGLPYFLEAAGIPFMPDANIDSLLQLHDTIDILTSRPLRILNDVSYAKGTIISKGQRHSYHTALRIWIDPEIRKTVSSLLQGYTGRLIAHGVPPGSLPHNQPALSVKSAPQALAPLQGFLQAKQPFAIIQPNGLNYKEWPGGIVLYHFALKNEKSGFQMLEATPRPFERFKLSATNQVLTVSKDHAYANLWSAAIPDTALHPLPDVLSIDLKSQFAPGQGGTLVFDVNRNGNNIHWEGQSLNPYHQKDSLNQPASFYFDWPDGLQTGDQLKVYLWSDSGGHCTLNSAVVSRINFSD